MAQVSIHFAPNRQLAFYTMVFYCRIVRIFLILIVFAGSRITIRITDMDEMRIAKTLKIIS